MHSVGDHTTVGRLEVLSAKGGAGGVAIFARLLSEFYGAYAGRWMLSFRRVLRGWRHGRWVMGASKSSLEAHNVSQELISTTGVCCFQLLGS